MSVICNETWNFLVKKNYYFNFLELMSIMVPFSNLFYALQTGNINTEYYFP